MSGGPSFNRFVKYTEVKFEGQWEISGGIPGYLTPPGFITYSASMGSGLTSSVTITRSDGKALTISGDKTTGYFVCAVGEDAVIFTGLPDESSDGPFQ